VGRSHLVADLEGQFPGKHVETLRMGRMHMQRRACGFGHDHVLDQCDALGALRPHTVARAPFWNGQRFSGTGGQFLQT
jgi:hypothetical protein